MASVVVCEICGAEMSRETVPVETQQGRHKLLVQQRGWWCWTCRVSHHSAADLLEPEPPGPPVRRPK